MRLGRVVGCFVATHKNEHFDGAKLLLVQPITAQGEPSATLVLALDAVQAGVGDTVLLVIEGRAAISVLRRRMAPVDAAIVGVVDDINTEGAPLL